MQGDFSRIPYTPSDNISRVLFQQGKPLVEADLNEALLALMANQRKIIRRIREDPNDHHGAFDSGFAASRIKVRENPDAFSFAIDKGDYRFEDLLFSNSRKTVAKSYTSKNVDQWIVNFAGEASTPTEIVGNNFVIGLAAIERPMLISEIENRALQVGYLRAGIPWIIDWVIFLQPDGGNPNVVRNAILARNEFPTLDTLDITVTSNVKLSNEFADRLWRVEIHKVDGREVVLKFAIDNASSVFRAKKETNVQLQRFNGELPRKGEKIEAESPRKWFVDPGVLHDITKLTEYRDGIIASTEPIAGEISGNNTDQVRVWQSTVRIKVEDLIVTKAGEEFALPPGHPGEEYKFTVHVSVPDPAAADAADVALAGMRRRDGWTFRSDQVASPGSGPMLIAGTRQPVYRAALGTVQFDGTGNVTAIGNTDYRTIILADLTEPPTNLVRSHRPSLPALTSRAANESVAAAVSCHRLFPEVENLAARRWLASTTLDEIAGLSKDELRTRIECDCDSHEIETTLDNDLNLIVAKRRDLLPMTTLA